MVRVPPSLQPAAAMEQIDKLELEKVEVTEVVEAIFKGLARGSATRQVVAAAAAAVYRTFAAPPSSLAGIGTPKELADHSRSDLGTRVQAVTEVLSRFQQLQRAGCPRSRAAPACEGTPPRIALRAISTRS